MTLVTVVLLLVLWALVRRDMRAREQRSLTLQQEQQRLESLVDERTAALTELSNYLQTVREEERAKLARDIHDELGGILVSAKMDVNWAEERVRRVDTAAAAKLERALKTLDDGVQIKRRIIEELRPTLLDNLGLSAALEWQLHEICDRAGLACEIATPEDDSAIPPTVSIALFRILQEALTNVLKYARASRVSVDLAVADGSVMLVIEDDGVGIPDNAHEQSPVARHQRHAPARAGAARRILDQAPPRRRHADRSARAARRARSRTARRDAGIRGLLTAGSARPHATGCRGTGAARPPCWRVEPGT